MSHIVALSGKGGTGKTTITSFLIDHLRKKGKASILAIDADPNVNLNQALGVEVKETIVGILDKVASMRGGLPAGMTRERYIEYEVQSAISEGEGFDLIAMGRPEGPGCYCYANNVLRGVIDKLSKAYDYVVIDNEAGMEHLSRRTTRKIDSFIVVSDFSKVGVRAAKRICELAVEMEIAIGKEFIVINMARGPIDELKPEIDAGKLNLACVIPYDERIEKLSLAGKPTVGVLEESRARKIFEEIKWV